MAHAASGTFARVMRNPALRRVQLAMFGSTLGDWAYATALTVWAYQVGGAKAVGIFQACRFVASAVAGPIAAVIADRVPRRGFMMVADATRAVLVAVAAVVVDLGGSPLVVFTLGIAVVMTGAAFRPAQAGLVPSLVNEPAELTATNALFGNLDTIASFVGPALGAALVLSFDVGTAFWLNAATYVWSLLLIAAVRAPHPKADRTASEGADDEAPEPPAEDGSVDDSVGFGREVSAGFVELGRNRDLATMTVLVGAQTLVWGFLTVFTVMIAISSLSSGAAGVGYLNAAMGVGSVVGGLAVLTRVGRGRLGQDMVAGVLGWSLPLLAMAVFPSPVVAFICLGLIGAADPFINLGLDTIPQRLAPDRVLVRVFAALDSALVAAMAAGALAAPVVEHALGLRPSLAVLGVAVSVLTLLSLPRMRRLDRRLALPEELSVHLELLGGTDVFAPLDPATLESIARKLEPVTVRDGGTILTEGQASDRFYLIESGTVRVSQGERELRIEGAGEYFGEIGLLRDVPRTATVTAVGDVRLLALDRTEFLRVVTGTVDSLRIAEDVAARRLVV